MNRVALSPDLARRWQDRDPFAAVDALDGELYRDVARRQTRAVTIAGRALFLKRHWGVGWWEILKNWLLLRRPVLGAADEWRALQRAAGAGIRVPVVVGFAERGRNPARRESFLLSEAVVEAVSLEEAAAEWLAAPPSAPARRRLIDALAYQVRDLHAAGINHRDLYLCHFLLSRSSWPDAPRLTLIDLHRAQIRDAVPERWRIKDLGALLFSAFNFGFTERDWLRFIRAYSERPLRQEFAANGGRWRAVSRRAERLAAEARRKGRPVGGSMMAPAE